MNFLCYQVRHSTIYDYSGTVTEASHLLKLRPRDLPTQRCLQFEVEVEPASDRGAAHEDYFGNETLMILVAEPHQRLEVTTRSRVAVGMPFLPTPAETPAWETVRGQILTDRGARGLEAMEYTYDSPLVDTGAEVLDYAHRSFVPSRPIMDAAKELTERIFRDFKFDPAATTIATPVAEIFKHRSGVCQDFAHLLIACFRSLGLAARYVSGYLETDPPPGGEKLIGADASHAWVSFYCPGIGWIDLDPTNGVIPGMRHIRIGWGRDYGDVCPLRGVINGVGDHQLTVGVDVIADGTMEIPIQPNEAAFV